MIEQVRYISKKIRKKATVLAVCALFLTPFAFAVSACQAKTGHESAEKLYQCSMHPEIVSDKPGNCPICGMRLTLKTPEGAAEPAFKEETVAGRIAVVVTPERQQLIGLKTALVEERELVKDLHVPGKVAYDHALYDALLEFRSAHEFHEQQKRKSVAVLRERADDLLDAARSRVELLGYNEDQMQDFLKAGTHAGAFALKQGEVGVTAEIYEYEMALVKPGEKVRVTTPAYPGEVFGGEVRALDPILNTETRTLKLRISIQDPGVRLRPEMFVDVILEVPLGRKLAVPASALIRTGEKDIVFVSTEGGRLEPRDVRIGQEAGGYHELLNGIKAGERVVVSANFLVDSESRFHAALAGYQGDGAKGGGHDHSSH